MPDSKASSVRDFNAGRNRNRAGRPDPPQEPGRIVRLLRVRAEEPTEQPAPGRPPREAAQVQGERVAKKQPKKRKLTPSQVMEDHEGPRLTFSQEVARILCIRPAEAPRFSQEDFPRLTSGGESLGPGATESNPPGQAPTHARPRSRSPHASVWTGAKGKHLEGGRQEVIRWPWQAKGGGPKQVSETQAPGQVVRKRFSEDRRDQRTLTTQENHRYPKIEQLPQELAH